MPDTPVPRSSFHHGDLPRQALAEARARIAAGGAQQLGFRELAATLGVNHRALYRHFADRQALVAAVAEAELAALVEAITQAIAPLPPARQRQRLMGVYVAYALDHPRLYELVFSLPLRDDIDAETPLGAQVRRLVQLAARVFAEEGDTPARTRDRAWRSWATAHGLLMLLQRGALRLAGRPASERYIVAAALGQDPAGNEHLVPVRHRQAD